MFGNTESIFRAGRRTSEKCTVRRLAGFMIQSIKNMGVPADRFYKADVLERRKERQPKVGNREADVVRCVGRRHTGICESEFEKIRLGG